MKKEFIIKFTTGCGNDKKIVRTASKWAESEFKAKMKFWGDIGLSHRNVDIVNIQKVCTTIGIVEEKAPDGSQCYTYEYVPILNSLVIQ